MEDDCGPGEPRSPKAESFDVVVIGGGGAGLAAAIEARQQGCFVLLIEKNLALGGSTSWSVGSVSVTGTPHQLRKGITDNPTDHWSDMSLFNTGALSDRDNAELRKILCDEAPDAFRWLLSLGIRFYGPMPEPPHKKPRMHNVLPNSHSFIYHLRRSAEASGVVVRMGARAEALVTREGCVVGVEVSRGGARQRVYARKGIVLAAGDFSNSPDLKRRYMGQRQAGIEGLNASSTGDGQSLALDLGARVINGDLALGPEIRFIPPARITLARRIPPWSILASILQWSLDHLPNAILRPFIMSFLTTALAPTPALYEHGAILINKAGRRFCNELAQPAFELQAQPDQIAYILIDARIGGLFSAWPHFVSTAPGIAYAYMPDYRRNRSDIFAQAATLRALATRLRMDPAALVNAVDQHNDQVMNLPDAANRPLKPLGRGPFIALGPVRAVFVHNEGGLKVDRDLRVLNGKNEPIGGLYAAGSNGQGGLLLRGHGHHLAWAFVSGRRAGRIVAAASMSV